MGEFDLGPVVFRCRSRARLRQNVRGGASRRTDKSHPARGFTDRFHRRGKQLTPLHAKPCRFWRPKINHQIDSYLSKTKIKWHKQQKHDYPAARTYLNLILPPRDAKKIVDKLKRAPGQEFAAKDVLRAANVPLLNAGHSDVKKERTLIRQKTALSSLLLFRDPTLGGLIIADGYHRLCAVFSFDEQAMIPCQIV